MDLAALAASQAMRRQLASKLSRWWSHVPLLETARFTRLIIGTLWCCVVVDYHDVGGVFAYRGCSEMRIS